MSQTFKSCKLSQTVHNVWHWHNKHKTRMCTMCVYCTQSAHTLWKTSGSPSHTSVENMRLHALTLLRYTSAIRSMVSCKLSRSTTKLTWGSTSDAQSQKYEAGVPGLSGCVFACGSVSLLEHVVVWDFPSTNETSTLYFDVPDKGTEQWSTMSKISSLCLARTLYRTVHVKICLPVFDLGAVCMYGTGRPWYNLKMECSFLNRCAPSSVSVKESQSVFKCLRHQALSKLCVFV